MRLLFFLILLFCNNCFAELLKPSPILKPQDVIAIQLNALKDNNVPYENAGIEQTWKFAHPNNKLHTGPLSNFKKMMYSSAYAIMLNHLEHKIVLVDNKENIAFFFVELIDKNGNEFGFKWILEKIISNKDFNDCWMTISVSLPMELSKST